MAEQKLYTEEQVRDILKGIMHEHHIDEFLKKYYTPIELPTDEEIWHESNQEKNLSKDYAFARGAEWMRNKILNK